MLAREEEEAWGWYENLFSSGVLSSARTKAAKVATLAKARAKGKGGAPRPHRPAVDTGRQSAARALKCLDAMLQRTTGAGLAYFSPSEGQRFLQPHMRPTLTMCID